MNRLIPTVASLSLTVPAFAQRTCGGRGPIQFEPGELEKTIRKIAVPAGKPADKMHE